MFTRRFAYLAAFALTLVGITGCGGNGIFIIPEPPASIEFALQPGETVVNAPFNTTVVFKNSLGHVMPLNDLNVQLYIENNAGGGTLLGTTQVASEFGVCYFFNSLNITEEGTGYTLRAEWEDKVAYSDPFDIIPEAVGSIAFDMGPVPTPAGDAFTVSVLTRDQNGLFLDRDGVLITLDIATNPAGGTLSGVTTQQTVAGIATFPGLSIDNFGNGYVLRATYFGPEGTFTALTGPFPILPPPVASIAFSIQPPDTPANGTFGCEVELRDAGGTPVPTDGLQVTLDIANNAGGGTLSGTKSALSVQGVCTFSGLSINKSAPGYTLSATHLAFNTTSAAFEILFVPPAWDTNLGTDISMADDASSAVNYGFSFPFYGSTYSSVWVNDNGNLTFGASNSDWSSTVSEMASAQPRIAALWGDMHNSTGGGGGTVHARVDSDKVVVTYNGVTAFFNSGSNNMQITMYDTGRIDIVFGAISGLSHILGISPGGNNQTANPVDFSATVHPSYTNSATTFPYEQGSVPDLANGGWIIFEPLGPSFDGTDGYRFTSSG